MQIYTIDLLDRGTPGLIAAFVVEGDGGPVLVESGPSATLDTLRHGLGAIGLRLRDIRHVLVTHVHFDHAGAAGHLACEGATIYVHELGAPHLVDPARLVASAGRIFGDALEQRWGPILPVPADHVEAMRDGEIVRFRNLEFTAVQTPGHARHHHAWRLETEDGPVCFTGDAAACFIEETDFISLPTPPPEFDREAWLLTLARLRAGGYSALYATHFGCVEDPDRHLDLVQAELIGQTAIVGDLAASGADERTIFETYRDTVAAKASRLGVPESKRPFYSGESHARMNVAGILRSLRKTAAHATGPAPAIDGARA